jgi:hypothetical protein
MKLADKLRAIANILDFLEPVGLADQVCPLDDNGTLEFTEAAHKFCLESAEGRQLLQILESSGVNLFVHESIYRRDELDLLFEV